MIRRFHISIPNRFSLVYLFLAFVFFSSCSEEPVEVRSIDVNPLVAEGKLDEAASEVTRALAEYPNNIDLLYNLASIQHLQGKYDVAMKTLSKALSVAPNDDEMNYLMVELLIDTNYIQDAWDRFQMLSAPFRQTARSQLALGTIYSLLNNWQNAESCFRAAIGLGDASSYAKSSLAFVACKQDRLDEAKAYLIEAETASNNSPEALTQIAECYLLLEQPQKVREIARKLTEAHPLDARYWSLLGRAEMKLLNFNDAESAFTRALSSSNASPWIQVHYAEMLYASNREDEALSQALDAETRIKNINLPVLNPSLYNLMATLYAKNGQFLLAQRYLNQSYQVDSKQPKVIELLQKIANAQQPNLSSEPVETN